MNKFFGFLLFGVLLSTVFTALSLDRRADIKLELVHPLEGTSVALDPQNFQSATLKQAKAEHLRLMLASKAYHYTGVLALRVRGTVDIVFQTVAPYETRDACTASLDRATDCRFVVNAGSDPLVIVIMPRDSEAVVDLFEIDIAEAKRITAASGPLILYGFVVLLLIGPVFVFLRRWEGAEQIGLIAAGSIWIALAGWDGLLLCYAFLAAGYIAAMVISRTPGRSRMLSTALVGAVLFIAFIKFIAPSIASSFANVGAMSLTLPLGISYFVIRLVDLVLAVNAKAVGNLNVKDYLAFMLMPQALPAGPIVTYSEFQRGRVEDYSIVEFGAGTARVAVGMTKKVGADSFLLPQLSATTHTFLIQGWNSSPETVLAMLFLTTIYVYLDFSAYSDLAIGCGRAAGRRIPENFDWPLLRTNIREYWRHWHMTLSQWVMRRVYLPTFLKTRSVTVSMVSCMMVIGLWHALSLPWVLWAFHHGLAMAAENKWLDKLKTRWTGVGLANKLFSFVGVFYVWFWVSIGHSLTHFASLEVALTSYILGLLAPIHLAIALLF